MERANGVISDTLRAHADGCKDDWDSLLTLAEFAIKVPRRAGRARDPS